MNELLNHLCRIWRHKKNIPSVLLTMRLNFFMHESAVADIARPHRDQAREMGGCELNVPRSRYRRTRSLPRGVLELRVSLAKAVAGLPQSGLVPRRSRRLQALGPVLDGPLVVPLRLALLRKLSVHLQRKNEKEEKIASSAGLGKEVVLVVTKEFEKL